MAIKPIELNAIEKIVNEDKTASIEMIKIIQQLVKIIKDHEARVAVNEATVVNHEARLVVNEAAITDHEARLVAGGL